MKRKYIKLYRKRIVERNIATDYYTHQGVSQRSIKLQRDTPFLMEKSEHGGVLFRLAGLWSVPDSEPGQDTGSDYPVFS